MHMCMCMHMLHMHTGQRWKALPEAEKAKYKSGLTCLAASGQGGMRTWVPTLAPSLLPTPTTTAVAMTQLNERRSSDSRFTATPVAPRPPTASPAASPAVPRAPSAAPSSPLLSSWLKQYSIEVAVEADISEELSEETWLSEMNIVKAVEETIMESNEIMETMLEAIEEHRVGVADLVAGEEAIGPHGTPPAQATETAAALRMAQLEHMTTAGMRQADPEWLSALYSKLDEDGRERQGTAMTTSPTSESLGHGQGSMTPEQQALNAARERMQSSHTDAEICQVVRTLAVALGAKRPEVGTIKALRAVLMLLERPEMSDEEAYTSKGASVSSFKRWRKQVQSAQLGVSLP